MNLFKNTLVFALLLIVVCSQIYDQSANLQQLQSKILGYQEDLTKLQKQVQRLKRDLSQAESTTIKIGALNQAQADQRDALISINSYLNLPFRYSQCECVNLSEDQRHEINQQIRSIRKQVKTLKYDILLQQRCPKMNAIRSQLERQLTYLQTVQYALNSKCCKAQVKTQTITKQTTTQSASGFADISTHIIQTNLNAGQWIYGCLSKSEVRLRYFSRTVNSNVTNCPSDKPYFDNTNCISCPSDKPVWDLCLSQCISCTYNKQQHTCIKSSSSQQTITKTKWQDVIVAPIEQQNQIVAPIVGSSTITIVTKNKIKTTRQSKSKTSHISHEEAL